jgi:archaellum component FlaC
MVSKKRIAMKRFLAATLVLVALTTGLNAASGPSADKQPTAAKKPSVAEQLQAVNEKLAEQQQQIQQQQEQINQLRQMLRQSLSQVQQLQQQNQQLQGPVQQVTEQAASTEQAVQTLTSSVAELQTGAAAVTQDVATTQKEVKELQSPLALKYKGISFTPGGFISADFVLRQRNENADAATRFDLVPFGGGTNAHMTEFRATARVSRASALFEGMAGKTKLTGYFEIDFLGAAPTANQVESNSFNPRLRQAFAQADMPSGWTLTAGQVWSLLTTDRKGIATRAEFIPNTVEAAYVVGYDYVRQNAVRITKNYNNRLWIAGEVANAETTAVLTGAPSPLFGFSTSTNALTDSGAFLLPYSGAVTCTPPASAPAGSVCNPGGAALASGISTNMAPDLLAKVAYEPGWGHYELKALGRIFRDRVGTTNAPAAGQSGVTRTSFGGGLGGAAILPLMAKKLDFIAEGLWGRGIGRYGAGVAADVTVRPDGQIVPIRAEHLMGGLEFHATPRLEIFFYGGGEYYHRTAYVDANGKGVGYGSPIAVNNSQCNLDYITSGTCGAQNRNLWEATGGLWYRLYRGSFGTFQWGTQYEYIERRTWTGIGGSPKGLENIGFTSFRYFLP